MLMILLCTPPEESIEDPHLNCGNEPLPEGIINYFRCYKPYESS